MSRYTLHATRVIGWGATALLLSTSYFLLPSPTYAAVWHCASCECNCNTRVTSSVTIEAPYTRDSTDPESVCVASCRTACGLPPDVTGVPQNFTGRGVSCTDVSATAAPAPGSPDEAAADAPAPRTPVEFGYQNPLGTTNLNTVINRIIKTALGFVGALFLAMFVYAGVLYMTAGGDAKKVDSAKKTMLNAVFGILIIATAYTIISLIFQTAGQVRGG